MARAQVYQRFETIRPHTIIKYTKVTKKSLHSASVKSNQPLKLYLHL